MMRFVLFSPKKETKISVTPAKAGVQGHKNKRSFDEQKSQRSLRSLGRNAWFAAHVAERLRGRKSLCRGEKQGDREPERSVLQAREHRKRRVPWFAARHKGFMSPQENIASILA